MLEKRALQVSIAILALLPVVGGLWGIVDSQSGGWADSHIRYLSGLLLAIGLGYWTAVPEIETMAPRIRLLTALVVTGGIARLFGLVLGDVPTPMVVAALAMELLVAPILWLWQLRVASRHSSPGIARMAPHLGHIAR